jgi:hypothetical protein
MWFNKEGIYNCIFGGTLYQGSWGIVRGTEAPKGQLWITESCDPELKATSYTTFAINLDPSRDGLTMGAHLNQRLRRFGECRTTPARTFTRNLIDMQQSRRAHHHRGRRGVDAHDVTTGPIRGRAAKAHTPALTYRESECTLMLTNKLTCRGVDDVARSIAKLVM